MTYFELKKYISGRLAVKCGELADYEAMLFIRALCGISGTEFLLRMKDTAVYDESALESFITRRINGESAEYIIGETYFFDLRIKLSRDCLVPRADTEFVVEKALNFVQKGSRTADLCTGSGCIAIAIAKHGGAYAEGFDISRGAIETASCNAAENGVADRVKFHVADVKNDVLRGEYDVIISNPPYIKSADIAALSPEVLCEPHIALDGGEDGMDFYRAILSYAPRHLKKGGRIVFEIGYDEENEMRLLCAEKGLDCDIFRDYGGNPRAAVIYKKGE